MNSYELVLLLKPETEAKEKKNLAEKIKDWLGKGKIEKEEDWGKKRLAYPIKKLEEAYYLFFLLKAEAKDIQILTNKLKLEENILRYLVLKK